MEKINPEGYLISASELQGENYKPFFNFLCEDENYRAMKAETKILYMFLRDRMNLSITTTIANETTGYTSAFRDNNGYIFCIAENAELEEYIGCSESTLIRYMKELEMYGLIKREKTLNRANRLYVLKPSNLQEVSTFKKRVELAKKKRKELNEQKAEKFSNKRKAASTIEHEKSVSKKLKTNDNDSQKKLVKSNKKTSKTTGTNRNLQNESYGNLQNESYGNLQNESYGNLQNESYGNLQNESLYKSIYSYLDLLNNIKIYQSDIETAFEKYVLTGLINILKFKQILIRLDNQKEIKNFASYLTTSIENELSKKFEQKKNINTKVILPTWFNTDPEELEIIDSQEEKNIEDRRKKMEQWIQEYTKNKNTY